MWKFPTSKNHPAPNASSSPIEKCYCTLFHYFVTILGFKYTILYLLSLQCASYSSDHFSDAHFHQEIKSTVLMLLSFSLLFLIYPRWIPWSITTIPALHTHLPSLGPPLLHDTQPGRPQSWLALTVQLVLPPEKLTKRLKNSHCKFTQQTGDNWLSWAVSPDHFLFSKLTILHILFFLSRI